MNSKLKIDLDYTFYLNKDGKNISNNNNFIIIDHDRLSKNIKYRKRDEDGFVVLNSSKISSEDEFIIQQGETERRNVDNLSLAVLYRCNGNFCDIRDDDKIKSYYYSLFFGNRGFDLNHQSPGKPIKPLEEEHFWVEVIRFLENINIVYYDWELI